MKLIIFASFVCLGTIFSTGCTPLGGNRKHNFDVVIYGGTAGGVTAAVQAAGMGKKVALIEPSQHFGGIMIEGLGGSDIDNQGLFQNSKAVGGLALDFYRRVAKAYDRSEAFEKMLEAGEKDTRLWAFESKVAESVIASWLGEFDIALFPGIYLSEEPDAVTKENTRITRIKTTDGQVFAAAVFIDASIEGDLLARAGVSTVVGRESNATYNETLNGIRAETTHAQFAVNVNPYKDPNDRGSGLIATIQEGDLGTSGEGDRHLQAFCFRVCMTKDTTNQIPFYKPEKYNRDDYEIYLRYLKAGGKLYRPWLRLPNGKTDLGAWHDLSHNLYGMNVDYPEGDYKTRERILEEHSTFTQGLFYFLANDEEIGSIAPDLQKEWALWGYAKDEFTDNRGFPRNFYVRDARRMVSDYVITEHHARRDDPVVVDDPVAVAYWPLDVHSVRRIVRNGFAYNEGFVFNGNYWRPFGISYRALVPRAGECTNLLTPTCPSSSHIAYGGIRIEYTFMALGQACGVAASLAADHGIPVQEIDYDQLKAILEKDKAVIDAALVGMPGEHKD